jgi:hypothetical protein
MALEKWITAAGLKHTDYLFPGGDPSGSRPLSGRQRYLASLGTEAAVTALSELIAGHPEFGYLAYELSLAMRIATWSPLSPKEVLALADKPNLTLVTSPADLCEVLVAALEKFNASLHGAQTPVRDLWDRQKGKDIYRPIDENALSDVITRFLRTELGSSGRRKRWTNRDN